MSPNRELCRTLAFTNFQLEYRPFKIMFWRLFWRNGSIRLTILPFTPLFFSSYRITLCQTLSNAFDQSKKAP